MTVLTNLSFQLYSFTAKKYFPSMGSRSKRIETFAEKKIVPMESTQEIRKLEEISFSE